MPMWFNAILRSRSKPSFDLQAESQRRKRVLLTNTINNTYLYYYASEHGEPPRFGCKSQQWSNCVRTWNSRSYVTPRDILLSQATIWSDMHHLKSKPRCNFRWLLFFYIVTNTCRQFIAVCLQLSFPFTEFFPRAVLQLWQTMKYSPVRKQAHI